MAAAFGGLNEFAEEKDIWSFQHSLGGIMYIL
jgi:hypothetical protein